MKKEKKNHDQKKKGNSKDNSTAESQLRNL